MKKNSILLEAMQNVPNNTYLSQCLTIFRMSLDSLLNEYEIVAVGAQKQILLDLNDYLAGVATWLRHLIFNRGSKTPNYLKHTSLEPYESNARYFEALLKLAERVCNVRTYSFFVLRYKLCYLFPVIKHVSYT